MTYEGFSELTQQIRSDWDRRISHDYRFWMSDGHKDDESMWEAGSRDYNILMKGYLENQAPSTGTIIEIGCGVGRILSAALPHFAKVIGVDISPEAISVAKKILPQAHNLELIVGSGADLKPIADESVDVAISFAALSSMPVKVISNYFLEVNRVLKDKGEFRCQIYLGDPKHVSDKDSLFIRSFSKEGFKKVVAGTGFQILRCDELVLPIQVSFQGMEAFIVTLKKTAKASLALNEIISLLMPVPENVGIDITPDELECWVSINYAKELVKQGKIKEAQDAITHGLSVVSERNEDLSNTLDKLISETEEMVQNAQEPSCSSTDLGSGVIFEENLKALKEHHPAVAELVLKNIGIKTLESKKSEDGPVLFYDGVCLDHQDRPRAAAKNWISRSLQDRRFSEADHIVVLGFGTGYHLEELLSITGRAVSAIEPTIDVLVSSMRVRRLTKLFSKLENIVLGAEIPRGLFGGSTELLVRPQSQAISTQQCVLIRSRFYGERGINTLHPTIGVLGPLQGGTQPIGVYTSRALALLNQRFRHIDMSGFAPGYHLIHEFLKQKPRQAVMEGNYVEILSQLVIESIDEKPLDILICMAQAPISGRALVELKKRGVITVLWFVEDYLRFTYWKDYAKYYDFVFTIQKGQCIELIKGAGAGEVHYLPTACDPQIHQPLTLSNEEKARWGSQVSFVGAGYYNRQQTFANLAGYNFKIWGTEWPTCRPFDHMVQEGGRRISPDEYIKIFNSSDINLNLHSSAEKSGVDPTGDFVNPRTFELAAAGAFQLTDPRVHLGEMFDVGSEIATFQNLKELKEKIAYYLAHPEERLLMANKARNRALSDHTYEKRIQEMLSIIYSSKYEMLSSRESNSPWKKMINRAAVDDELKSRCEHAFKRGEAPVLDGLVYDIINGKGKLTPTEQKLLFLYHVRKQIIQMESEEKGVK